jgi:hypothetical protein
MLAKIESGFDGWLDRHGAAVGIVLTLLTFVGTVEMVLHLTI